MAIVKDISDLFSSTEESSMHGFSFIIGKVLKGSGLKLTQDKLLYEKKLEMDNHQSKVGHVVITESVFDLFKILEMDVNVFDGGFDSQEDMFEFIVSTPYLKSSKFTDITKKYKQVFYDFKEFLISNNINTPGKNITIEHIDSCVDFSFLDSLKAIQEKERIKRERILKFSGRTIIDNFPDIEMNKVGLYFGQFKHSFGSEMEYKNFIDDNSVEDILRKFESETEFV